MTDIVSIDQPSVCTPVRSISARNATSPASAPDMYAPAIVVKRARIASTVAPPEAHSCKTIAQPSTGNAAAVTLRPAVFSPGAIRCESGPARGDVSNSTGSATQPSTIAKRRTLRRAPGSTSSGTEVSRKLWLNTPKVEYSAKATKKPSVRALVPKRPR